MKMPVKPLFAAIWQLPFTVFSQNTYSTVIHVFYMTKKYETSKNFVQVKFQFSMAKIFKTSRPGF